jgi:hypothetical protein
LVNPSRKEKNQSKVEFYLASTTLIRGTAMQALKLPVVRNMFAKPKLQAWVSDQLQGMELKVFYKTSDWDEVTEWEEEDDFSDAQGNPYFNRCYDMIGLAIGEWVFLPTMTHKLFRLNGDWYTITINEYGKHQLARTPNGDEAEQRFQLEWEKYECRT